MENQELELKVDAGDRQCHSDGDLNDDHALEKEGCEVPVDDNGSCVVVVEVGDVADEGHCPEGKDCELTVDVNGGCVEMPEAGDAVDDDHSPDAAENDYELSVDVNGGCVAKTEAGDVADEAHSDDIVDVNGGCVVVKDESDLNVGAPCNDADVDEEKKECEAVKEDVTVDASNAAVNGGCLAGKEEGECSAEAVTAKVNDQELGQRETSEAAKEDIERSIGHYTNRQKILLVGEGDFAVNANGGCVAKTDVVEVAYKVHSPDAAEKGFELTVDVNGGCVEKTEGGDAVDDVRSPDAAEKECELTADVNGGCVAKTEAGDVADEAHSDDTGPGAVEKDCEAAIDVNGGCAVAREESDLNADAHSHDADLDEEKNECEATKENAVNGGCLAGKEKGEFSAEAVTTKVADQELGQKEEDIELRIGHYTNRQKILLVGEGDFSFAACLAKAFRRATNITATSLDDRASVIRKYSNGEKNLQSLEDYGAIVIHQVDAHTMNRHPELEKNLYDRIVFNFPHDGRYFHGRESQAWVIENHQKLVAGFFKAAKYMVGRNGEIHVTHKSANPFDRWNIEELAEDAGLVLRRKAEFCRWVYPGYENKKAYGIRPDSTFPVGRCSTFMFSTG